MRNLINQLYRPTARIGDGGTAAYLRDVWATGGTSLDAGSHFQKANDKIKALQNLYRDHGSTMTFNDLEIALQLLKDLRDAVRLFT